MTMVYTEDKNTVIVDREVEARPLCGVKWRACIEESRSQLWRVAAAETCGTAMLVLLTCLPGCGASAAGASLLQRALTSGLVVAVVVQCFDHVSGAQINPMVTLAAVMSGRVSVLRGVVMGVSQLVGGILGATVLRLLAASAVQTCVTKPADYISIYQALAIETLLGMCLTLAILASWDARNRHLLDSWPLRIGLTVAALSLAAGDLTGASMNPVRSFAPALLSGDWDFIWVYLVSPLCGAFASVALYLCTWRVPAGAAARDASPPPLRRAPSAQTMRPSA